MSTKKIKEKIRKILALSTSPNENEAKAALIKARAMMKEYKLMEADVLEEEAHVVTRYAEYEVTSRTNFWVLELAAVIGPRYCCKPFRCHKKRGQKQRVGFVGLSGDIDICMSVFDYAVGFVFSRHKNINKLCREKLRQIAAECCDDPELFLKSKHFEKMCRKESKRMRESYGLGFVQGVDSSFQKQDLSDEAGLVLVVPKEVEQAVSSWGDRALQSRVEEDIDGAMYIRGYKRGKEFSPNKILE